MKLGSPASVFAFGFMLAEIAHENSADLQGRCLIWDSKYFLTPADVNVFTQTAQSCLWLILGLILKTRRTLE